MSQISIHRYAAPCLQQRWNETTKKGQKERKRSGAKGWMNMQTMWLFKHEINPNRSRQLPPMVSCYKINIALLDVSAFFLPYLHECLNKIFFGIKRAFVGFLSAESLPITPSFGEHAS